MKNKSFTVIELLVVIAIIALIASIVLITFKDATERARIAKILQWSQSIHSLLGADAVGIWNLDENPATNGTTIADLSGWGNNGTLYTNDGAINKSGLGAINNALSFDGTDDYVDCGNDARLDITDAITIEIWINPATAQEVCWDGATGNYGVAGKVENAAGSTNWSWQLRYGSSDSCRLGFQFNTVGAGAQWATAKRDLTIDQWHHIVGTFDGIHIKFYADGELKDTNRLAAPTTIVSNLNKLLIANEGWANYFNGLIDEVRIYKEALPAQAIRNHYLAGLEKHQNLVSK